MARPPDDRSGGKGVTPFPENRDAGGIEDGVTPSRRPRSRLGGGWGWVGGNRSPTRVSPVLEYVFYVLLSKSGRFPSAEICGPSVSPSDSFNSIILIELKPNACNVYCVLCNHL